MVSSKIFLTNAEAAAPCLRVAIRDFIHRNRLTENHTNTKKRLTRINKSHALQRQITAQTYGTNLQKQKTAVTHQRFPHVGPHFPHSKTITTMTRLHDKNDNDQMMAITAS